MCLELTPISCDNGATAIRLKEMEEMYELLFFAALHGPGRHGFATQPRQYQHHV